MDKINVINIDLNRIKKFLDDNKEKIKTAALPILIGTAVLFFWIYGSEREEISVSKDGISDNDAVYGQAGVSNLSNDTLQNLPYDENVSRQIYVDISGAVKNSGVYQVSEGTRLFQVIEMAGGLKENADVNTLNRAEAVYDGQKIVVGTLNVNTEGTDGSIDDGNGGNSENSQLSGITNGKVNLNLADSATLQTIPGIGPSKADRIIEYRNTEGRFKKIEDIKNITGIGDKTFESIKNYITV